MGNNARLVGTQAATQGRRRRPTAAAPLLRFRRRHACEKICQAITIIAIGINTVSMLLLMLMMFATAWLSDKVGRKPMMLGAAAFCCVAALPLFWMMHHSSPLLIFLGQLGFVLALGMSWGVQPSIMVEATPPGVRCTVIALAFNITMGLVGGTTPLVATWLVARTHEDLGPAFLVIGAAAVSFLSVLSFGESFRSRLAVA